MYKAFKEELARSLNRLSFGKWPTPVEKLEKISTRLGTELYVKRDDLSGDEYGGNRVRQMEWLLADIKKKGARRILTFGGVGSNYIVALAAYARHANIQCEGIVIDQPLTTQVRKNLLLAQHFGASIHFAQTFLSAALVLWKLRNAFIREDGVAPYVVRPGAATPIGSLGYALGALELAEQIRSGICPQPQRIFVATSSCGTTAGLLAGISLSGLEISVTGVQVADSYVTNSFNIRWITNGVLRLFEQYAPRTFSLSKRSRPEFELCKNYLGGRYGVPIKAGEDAVEIAKNEGGLTLEGTYTGKAFAAFLAWAQRPENTGEKALFWNTYNSVDFSAILKDADWRLLPQSIWKYFDGSIPIAAVK